MMKNETNTNERQITDFTHRIKTGSISNPNLANSPYEYPKTECYIFSVKPEGYNTPFNLTLEIPKRSIDQEHEVQSYQPFQSLFEREQQAFLKMLPKLLETSPDQYVAILNGTVIDQDFKEIRLAERIELKHRSEFVLIRKVSEEKTDEYLESPEEELP